MRLHPDRSGITDSGAPRRRFASAPDDCTGFRIWVADEGQDPLVVTGSRKARDELDKGSSGSLLWGGDRGKETGLVNAGKQGAPSSPSPERRRRVEDAV